VIALGIGEEALMGAMAVVRADGDND